MRISGFASHEVPNLDDPEQFARLQAAIMREQGYKKMPLPRPRPTEAAGVPLPQPRPEGAPAPQWQPPEPLPGTEGLLPQGGDQPDWYKRMIEHQQRWGYDPGSQQNLPGEIDKTGQITDVLMNLLPMEKLPFMGRNLLGLARQLREGPWSPGAPASEVPSERTFMKERPGDKDYDASEIRRRMEAIQRGEPPSPRMQQIIDKGARPGTGTMREQHPEMVKDAREIEKSWNRPYQQTLSRPVAKPPRRDYTIEEIGEAMRQIMRERGMEP
jgi:hypothetical protein